MVEVIGSSPTAPTNKKRHAELRVSSYWWGRTGRVRGINDTRYFFTTQNAVGRQFALANSCRRTPACGKRQSLYRPTPSTKAKFGCLFSMWWGVKGEADRNLKQTRLRPPFFFDFEQAESFSRISP